MSPGGNDKQPILEARNLSKEFHTGGAFTGGTVKAVQGASFTLYRGHVVALVGESGSGKSTIVRMLARLYEPTEGDILYEGENVLEQRGTTRPAGLSLEGADGLPGSL